MHAGSIRREGTVADLTEGSVSTIRFVPPGAVDDIPIPLSRTENGLAVIETRQVQRDVTVLMAWAAANGYLLGRFTVRESGLDDIFRALRRHEGAERRERHRRHPNSREMLLRNRLVAGCAILLPLAFGVFLYISRDTQKAGGASPPCRPC